jgi:hypothetical protein
VCNHLGEKEIDHFYLESLFLGGTIIKNPIFGGTPVPKG